MLISETIAAGESKYSLTPNQRNIKPHTLYLHSSTSCSITWLSTKHDAVWHKVKIQSEETRRASEPHSDKAEMLELSDWEFKTVINNIQRDRIEIVSDTQE